MTLARRLILKSLAHVIGIVTLGVSVALGLASIDRAARVAHDEFVELRMTLEIGRRVAAARQSIESEGSFPKAVGELQAARRLLDEFEAFQGSQRRDIDGHEEAENQLFGSIRLHLIDTLQHWEVAARSEVGSYEKSGLVASLDPAETALRQLVVEMDSSVALAHRTAEKSRSTALMLLALISAAILFAVVLVNLALYRAVLHPLRRLQQAARRIACGRFGEGVHPIGDQEFREVASEFNQMGAQLDELYRDLEGKVREKSRELVRSERLASVGYLAAGVAHEINNPLSIISGYAELTLKRLRRGGAIATEVELEKPLRIIRDESFRCKEITERLLSLASQKERTKERVALNYLLDEVASMLASLKPFRNRKIRVHCEPARRLDVLANETEFKQVLLNLVLNALQAVEPEVGMVDLDGRRRGGIVELTVADNGRGMDHETLDRIFEPFFSMRNGADAAHGMGLGLSITRAIVESNGGRIRAESAGLSKGSRFVIELPAFDHETPV